VNRKLQNWVCWSLGALPALTLAQQVPSIDPDLLERSRKMLDAPAEKRPGDEKLTCAQINAELAALWGTMDKEVTSVGTTAKRAHAEQTKLQREMETEAPARQATTMTSVARSALLETVNPVAAKAEQRREESEMRAQIARDTQRTQAARSAFQDNAMASGDLLRAGMQGGQFERMKTLNELAKSKKCPPPQGLSGSKGEKEASSETEESDMPSVGEMLKGILGR